MRARVLLGVGLRFRDSEDDMRDYAARAVGGIGAAAGTPEILSALAAILRDPNASERRRWSAAYAVGGIGAVAGTPDFLDELAHCPDSIYLRDVLGHFVEWRWFDRGGEGLVRTARCAASLAKAMPRWG